GKTYVAEQLGRWLHIQPQGLSFGDYLELTRLHELGAEREIPPRWWGSWQISNPAVGACWIIDALDEGEERVCGIRERILRAIIGLDDAHRNSLRLLMFSRQRDWLPTFRAELGECYNLGPLQELREFKLAPLDRCAAIKR